VKLLEGFDYNKAVRWLLKKLEQINKVLGQQINIEYSEGCCVDQIKIELSFESSDYENIHNVFYGDWMANAPVIIDDNYVLYPADTNVSGMLWHINYEVCVNYEKSREEVNE